MQKQTSKFITLCIPLILAAALALSACSSAAQAVAGTNQPTASQPGEQPTPIAPTAFPTAAPIPVQPPSLTVEALKNAAYQSNNFAMLDGATNTIQLTNGEFVKNDPAISTEHPAFTVKFVQSAAGDLNGDGMEDAAVVLGADTGGSGYFEYLAAVINRDDQPEAQDAVLLGDRVIIDSMAIQDGAIVLNVVTHGPQDPMCCPTLKVSETYLLDNGRLITQAEKIAGPLASGVLQALKDKDMSKLASYVQPAAGVRFSPYSAVKEKDLVFTPDQLPNLFNDPTIYLWGVFDGSGAPMELNFADYYARFVYSADFAGAGQVSYNSVQGTGNTLENTAEFYPGSIVVEYYVPGTDANGGMDWQSLRLVFQQLDGKWWLVGIVHNQWTI